MNSFIIIFVYGSVGTYVTKVNDYELKGISLIAGRAKDFSLCCHVQIDSQGNFTETNSVSYPFVSWVCFHGNKRTESDVIDETGYIN